MNAPLMLLVLALGGVPPEPAATPATGREATVTVERVMLEVDHTPLLAQQMAAAAEKSGLFVQEDATRALREQHGVEVVEDGDAHAIVVKLAWKDYENSLYLIEIGTRRPGEELQVVETFEATCINNSALTEAVLGKLPAALEKLAEPREAPLTEPTDDPVPGPTTPPSADNPEVDRPERVPLGPKGKAGIGLLAGGAVGVITGAIVFAQQQRFDEDPSQEVWQGRDFGPPGVGVMIAGGAVAITGAVLLILDRTQARRARETPKPGAWLMPTTRGLALTGRF